MPRPRGRPPRPPRTDLAEIGRNRDEKLTEARGRAESMFPREPDPPLPTEPTARRTAAAAEWARITGLTPPPVTDVGEPTASTGGGPGKWLTAEDIAFLSDPETSPAAIVAKALPKRPDWIARAFVESVAVVRAKFGPARSGPFLCRLLTPKAAEWMLEPTGIEALFAHADRVTRLFGSFAALGPVPQDYADLFRCVLVPTYNAVNFDSRRCIECGKVFALRAPKEVETSRHCSDECNRRASKRGRERVGNGRSAAENVVMRLGKRMKRHYKNCPLCRKEAQCEEAKALFDRCSFAQDALERGRGSLPE